MGRRKVEMKAITNKSSRQVTFSKRRTGLFKKANELSSLCSSEIAIIAFSPGGKAFSYGYPDVNSVISRFLNHDGALEVDESDKSNANQLNQKLVDLVNGLKFEKKRGEMLGDTKKRLRIDELGLHELEELKGSMEELLKSVKSRLNEIEASSSLLLLAKNPTGEDEV